MKRILLALLLGMSGSVLAQSLVEPDVPTGLLERKGDKIVDAPPEDFAVAKTYHSFPGKGSVKDGLRITVLTAKLDYKIGEPVRVIHILESVKPGIKVYVMGPKAVTDEYIDGHLVGPKGPLKIAYRGVMINRPIADFNYEITAHTFTTAGRHTIQWKGGFSPFDLPALESNTIVINVGK